MEYYLQHGHSFHETSMLFLHTRHLLFWSQQQPPGKQKQGEESRKQAQCLGALYKTAVTVGSGIWEAVYQQLMAWLLSSIYSLLHDFGKHRLFWHFLTCFQKAFCKSRHWEQTGALSALGCWRHPLLRLETLLQENLLGSLLAENQKSLSWFEIIFHHFAWFEII